MNIDKNKLISYIHKIINERENSIYQVINPTLIANPFISKFPKRLFDNDVLITSKFKLFIKWTKLCYKINFHNLKNYFHTYKYYKKITTNKKITINEKDIILDLYAINFNTYKTGKFEDSYLKDIYKYLDEENLSYIYLLRLLSSDYKKYNELFMVAFKNSDKYIFEFDFINYFDFIKIFIFILIYPFKTLKLIQTEKSDIDIIFNVSLIRDISSLQFDSITRYLFAKKLAKIKNIKNIYSWCENQSINRTFNYGIRTTNKNIKIKSLQFFVNPKNYFNSIIYNIDYTNLTSGHEIYVQGKYYLKDKEFSNYKLGFVARNSFINHFKRIKENYILLLGSHFVDNVFFEEYSKILIPYNSKFKAHPTNRSNLEKIAIEMTDKTIEELFPFTSVIITSSSGTITDALACGISVIVLTDNNNINLDYTTQIGYKMIWDSISHPNELENTLINLLDFRKTKENELLEISNWYKENFFEEINKNKVLELFEG